MRVNLDRDGCWAPLLPLLMGLLGTFLAQASSSIIEMMMMVVMMVMTIIVILMLVVVLILILLVMMVMVVMVMIMHFILVLPPLLMGLLGTFLAQSSSPCDEDDVDSGPTYMYYTHYTYM